MRMRHLTSSLQFATCQIGYIPILVTSSNAKHFKTTQPRYKQVVGTSALLSVPQSGVTQSDTDQVKDLIIELDARDPDTTTFGKKVYVVELAERILGVARKIVP